MKKKFIYIAGLYHSGSTLLDQYLGSNSQIIGLGEIAKYIKDGSEGNCTCGKKVEECDFWSKINIERKYTFRVIF